MDSKKFTYKDIQTNDITLLKINSMISFELINSIIYDKIIPNCIKKSKDNIVHVNYVNVEMVKRIFILKNITNIEIPETVEPDLLLEISNWSNKIWDKITKKIKNYELFETLLEKAINAEISKLTKIEYKLSELMDVAIEKINNFDLKTLVDKIDPALLKQLETLIPKEIKDKN